MTEAAFMPLMRTGLDPVAALGEVREREPVSKLEFPFGITAWLITGYDEAKAVLGSSGDFSNDFSNITAMTEGEAGEDQNPGGLGMADPPNHTRLRKMLTPEFTMRRLQRLIPRIEELVGELLDGMESAGSPVDFVEAFAMPLPSLVICELLDVPYPDRQQFQRLSGARFDIFGGAGTGLEAISESLEFMGELVRAQRTEPGDGLLGMLIREYGDEIDDRELAGLADGLLIGGHETTASMLALGAIALLSDQAHAALMRTADTEAVHCRRRGAAALPHRRPGRVPAVRARGRRGGRSDHPQGCDGAGVPVRGGSRPDGWVARSIASIRGVRSPHTSPSATASIAASAPSLPASSCGSPIRPCSGASRRFGSTCRWTRSVSASTRSSTGWTGCRWPGEPEPDRSGRPRSRPTAPVPRPTRG